MDRRTFLKEGLLASAALTSGGATLAELARAGIDPSTAAAKAAAKKPAAKRLSRARGQAPGTPPNILVILVDQMRTTPRWLSQTPIDSRMLPNVAGLGEEGVTFASHYTASNDCTPARSTLLTGLYTHQTGCMITGGSTLNPEFPTWGSMLREHGYGTWWFGKWHLTHGDNRWTSGQSPDPLEAYGFAGGTFPSPNGAPGQGWRVDPHITEQFEQWFSETSEDEPWCTTVSLVNPHDIAWWYLWSDRTLQESTAPKVTRELPPNFETPNLLIERKKPRLQRSLQETSAISFGPVPFNGPDVKESWLPFLDLYSKLQTEVDTHVGSILRTLSSRRRVADNTVIVFTSDHGEYGASHGLRGKGAGAYEEAIRVPLIVSDRRKKLTKGRGQVRQQITSSVDVAPMLLTIATGSSHWRKDSAYAHIASRLDLAQIVADPAAAGRQYALHATDEIVTEFAIVPYAAGAPLHVTALLTPQGKFAIYANWSAEGTTPLSMGEEAELYDYATASGRLELHNSAGQSHLEDSFRKLIDQATREELRGELPAGLVLAQVEGFADYFSSAKRAARSAIRRRNAEQKLIQVM